MLAFASCKKENENKVEKERVFKGPVQQFQHHGKAWTSYEIDGVGNPLKLSIVIDDEAMNNLDRGTGGHEGGHHTHKMACHCNSILKQQLLLLRMHCLTGPHRDMNRSLFMANQILIFIFTSAAKPKD